LLQSRDIDGINNGGLPQATFSLATLLGQDVALKRFGTNDLSRSGSFKAFRRGSVGFHFGHCILHNFRHESQVSRPAHAPRSRQIFSPEKRRPRDGDPTI
jgi:hypothetical protein